MIRIALDNTWPEVTEALCNDAAFRTSFVERLRAVRYDAWFWECIRVSGGTFECVVIDAPELQSSYCNSRTDRNCSTKNEPK
jgi:hypothetical protein